MQRVVFLVIAALALVAVPVGGSATWSGGAVSFTNKIADTPFQAGGYAGYAPGATAPTPGSCRLGNYNANLSESWLAVQPGTENLIGTSKVFFEKFSTFYNFHLGSHRIVNGAPSGSNIVQGYECVTTGTQEMPPSWMNNTDPNVAFESPQSGRPTRAYQVTLPFNPYWVNLHPNSNIGFVYSDDLGQHWLKGNGGEPLEHEPNWSSLSLGFVEDKQWVAVNHFPLTRYHDHVYATWAVYNGQTAKIKVAVSRDRGQSFSKAVTVTRPQETSTVNEYVYPAVDSAGNVYLAIASSSPSDAFAKTIYVSRSSDDGVTWGPWLPVASSHALSTCCLPNTTFRDGILENFAVSEDYPGHLYMSWEDWDGSQFDVKFTQSTDYGMTWSTPVRINDADPNDQFQPSVAAGPGGVVAVAFYDRRESCPNDTAVIASHVGRANFCIDTTLQAFRDAGTSQGALKVGGNVRITQFTWDPEQPDQTIGGLDQMACAGHQNPCTTRAFIGDYFGLAVSDANVYALFASTHYPSAVVGDGGATVYYQRQILATVARSALGMP